LVAIYTGAGNRFNLGSECNGFTGKEHRADMPENRDTRTNLLPVAQRIRWPEDFRGKAALALEVGK
jgi:hypothetical protein